MNEPQVASGSALEGSAQQSQEEFKKESVSYETHQKLLSEKKRFQAQAQEYQSKVAEYENMLRSAKEQELKEKENWKALFESRTKELEETRRRASELEEQQANIVKVQSLMSALGGRVDKKYLPLLPVHMLSYDNQTGEVEKTSLESAVELVKNTYPEIYRPEAGVKVTPVSPSTPNVNSKDELLKLFAKHL